MSVWPAWGSHSGVNSSQLNADDTQQHLEFLLCDPWNQSHFCASLTRHKKEVRAPPPKPNLIGIAKFPLLAILALTVAADICSVICQPSLIECTFTSDIVSVWPGCTLPRLIPVYIIESLKPATSIRKHRPPLVEFKVQNSSAENENSVIIWTSLKVRGSLFVHLIFLDSHSKTLLQYSSKKLK